MVSVPGIPIIPETPIGPLYLTKIGLKYTSSEWPVTESTARPCAARLGLALGPEVQSRQGRCLLAHLGRHRRHVQGLPVRFACDGTFDVLKVKAQSGNYDAITRAGSTTRRARPTRRASSSTPATSRRSRSTRTSADDERRRDVQPDPAIGETEPFVSGSLDGALNRVADHRSRPTRRLGQRRDPGPQDALQQHASRSAGGVPRSNYDSPDITRREFRGQVDFVCGPHLLLHGERHRPTASRCGSRRARATPCRSSASTPRPGSRRSPPRRRSG